MKKKLTNYTKFGLTILTIIILFATWKFLWSDFPYERAKLLGDQDYQKYLKDPKAFFGPEIMCGIVVILHIIIYFVALLFRITETFPVDTKSSLLMILGYGLCIVINLVIDSLLTWLILNIHSLFMLLALIWFLSAAFRVERSSHRSRAYLSLLGLSYSLEVYFDEYMQIIGNRNLVLQRIQQYKQKAKY